jgi:ATP-dependent helicase/nuclease subunit A
LTPAYRVDGRPASREAFYAAACDPRRNVVVEACAGAGKTWMLVSRIVRALLAGAEPQEILAITFTRKAAGEMRTRLADWLRDFAHMSDEQRLAELRARGLDAAQAHAQAAALEGLHQQVLASGRGVGVRTFHAWFAQLLRAAPLELLDQLGIASAPELVEDLDDLKPELMRRFHAAVLADPALHERYTALVAARGRHTLLSWLTAAWDKRVEVERAAAAGTLAPSVPPALADGSDPLLAVAALRDDALALAAQQRASGQKLQIQTAEAIEAAFGVTDVRARFVQLWKALFTNDGEPRKKIGSVPPALLESLEALRDADAQQQAHDEHLHMVALARCLLREYAALKRRRALVDMADLEQVAIALLSDATLSGWVQQRLDARVRHLLIDEFQDTSPLQWQALHAWLSAYAGAGGGRDAPSVFIVGDPKQSIYRFRRAEPRVFDAARRFVVEGLQGQVLECDHTRRNAPAVLSAVNAVFGRLHAQGHFPGWRSHSTEAADLRGAGVHALPAVERPPSAPRGGRMPLVWRPSLTVPRREPEVVLREAEARQVAHAVAALLRDDGIGAGEVMVLCRKRESLQLAAEALQALHIPCTAPQDVALAAAPEVRDLIALLDVLASPGHGLSLAQALKSPLFGASDADLLALSQAAGRHGGWWPALMAGAVPALGSARERLAQWQLLARALPPHDLLDRVVHESDLHARLAAVLPAERRADAHDAVDALLAQALELGGGRYATVYGFVRALKQRTTIKLRPAVRADAVRLLTIHGAKGLEARVVFVMDTDPEGRGADTATLLIDWPVERDSPASVAFVANQNRCPPSLRGLLQAELAARAREERNGLYVAMTRARQRLVFSHTPPWRGTTGPSWWEGVADLAQPWIPPPAASRLQAGALAELEELPPAPPLLQGPADDPPVSTAAALGRALHRVLEWAAARPGADLAHCARAACAEQGMERSDAARVERLATQVLASPQAARFFEGDGLAWAGNEVPLADAGEVLRADRLVRLADAWWVLDYKLEHRPDELPAYRAQLARYRRAVQALVGDEPVRAAFIAATGAVVEMEEEGKG